MSDERFNPEMLVIARLAREMTQGDLAKVAKTTQARVSRIEHGLLPPPSELVERFAHVLDFPKSFFYQEGRIPPLPIRFHRKRRLARRTLDRIHAEITIRATHVAHLLRSTEVKSEREIPRIDADDYEGNAEDIARAVRQYWGVPRGPIPNLVELIERAGAVVIPCDFGVPEVDAVGLSVAGLPMMIFTNSAISTDRLRFTLAHELGHLVMHTIPSGGMEAEANRFAAELLMPEQDIKPQLRTVTLPVLAALKKVWRVSMAALLERAKQLRTIGQRSYFRLLRQLAPYRRREPAELDLTPEPPRLLQQLIDFHRSTLEYGVNQIAGILRVGAQEFQRMYYGKSHQLQLVG